MILSHVDIDFPYRRQLLVAAIALCAVASLFVPAEDALTRAVAPLVTVLLAAPSYAFILVALSLFDRVFPRIAYIYALFFYYAGLFCAPLLPLVWWATLAHDPSAPDLAPPIQVASSLATAAAAYKFTRRDVSLGR